jgi:hypothetical protein
VGAVPTCAGQQTGPQPIIQKRVDLALGQVFRRRQYQLEINF